MDGKGDGETVDVIQTCPICFRADDVRWSRLPEQSISYVCDDPHGGAGPNSWTAVTGSREPTEAATAGVTAELLEPLLRCVREGDPFVEYGVVEYRLRTGFPALFHAHVADRGHSILGHRQATASSVRFAATLGRPADQGALLKTWGPATGAWSRNERVTYWARPPAPVGPQLTWADFCASISRSPEWTAEDVEELTRTHRSDVVTAASSRCRRLQGGDRVVDLAAPGHDFRSSGGELIGVVMSHPAQRRPQRPDLPDPLGVEVLGKDQELRAHRCLGEVRGAGAPEVAESVLEGETQQPHRAACPHRRVQRVVGEPIDRGEAPARARHSGAHCRPTQAHRSAVSDTSWRRSPW